MDKLAAPDSVRIVESAIRQHEAFDQISLMQSEVKTPADSPVSEIKYLYRLALPLMGAQLAQMGMGVLDTVMAGRLGAVQLAGVALGGSVLFPVMMVMMGVLQSVSPSVAQLNGANRREEIGEIVRQALWMAILASIVIDFITYINRYKK